MCTHWGEERTGANLNYSSNFTHFSFTKKNDDLSDLYKFTSDPVLAEQGSHFCRIRTLYITCL